MSIPQTQALKKSQTHSFALPNISKTQAKMKSYRTAGANTTRHHSVFLDKIKDMTKNVRYEEMQTSNINQQQKQLKSLLRQFNKQTYSILNRYIDRPSEVKSSKKPRATSTSMMEIKDKQISNSNDVLQLCKREMQVLQRKCQNLKYVTVDEFQRKIDSIKKQIEELIVSNKQIIKGNTLKGLAIKKGQSKNYNQVSQIQQQKFILQRKKQKLLEETKIVTEEQQKLKQNHNKADQQIKKLFDQYNKYDKESKQIKQQKQLVKLYEQKKRQYTIKKQKLEGKTQKIQKQSTASQQSQSIQQNQKNLLVNQSKALIKSEGFDIKANQTGKKQKQRTQIQNPGLAVIASMLNTGKKQKQKQKQKVQGNKQRTQSVRVSNKYQLQYLKLLKQLDETLKSTKNYEQAGNDLTTKVEVSRKEILMYEHKLAISKKPIEAVLKNASQANDKNKDQEAQEKKAQGKNQQQNKKWSLF